MADTGTRQHEAGAPPRHHMALLVWAGVLPTLIVLQSLLGQILMAVPWYLRTSIMATLTVPIVIYVLMPPMLKLRQRVIEETRR